MKITVLYLAHARQAAGVAKETIELEAGTTVSRLVVLVAERHGPALRDVLLDAAGQPQRWNLLFVNDQQLAAGADPIVCEGDELTILPPISGG